MAPLLITGLAIVPAATASHAASPWPTLPALSGFGSSTAAGSKGAAVKVTNLNDSGPGSLRTALAGNKRVIKFSVGGTINLKSQLIVRNQSNLSLLGTSAPSPGITLTGFGLTIRNSHDVIVQGIRVRNTADDNMAVWDGSYNVVVDHCSLANSGDGNIDITENTHDVTVSWTLIGDSRPDSYTLKSKATLIANFNEAPVTRVSLHNNAWINIFQRSPQVSTKGVVDIRNNVMAGWGYYGVRLRAGAMANVVNNYMASPIHSSDALVIEGDSVPGDGLGAGPTFVSGNAGTSGSTINSLSNALQPYSVAAVPTAAAGALPSSVVAKSGVFPRDALDAQLLGGVSVLH